jgi:D-alanine-D-alanine ligase
MKKLVGVIFGGRSGEHEIAIRSAKTVIEQIDHERFDVLPILINNAGHWQGPHESAKCFGPETRTRFEPALAALPAGNVALIGDPDYKGIRNLDEASQLPVDVFFPVLHGTFGEDGTIQGLFDMADVPYVGCGVLASSCGMDKTVMKALFRESGLPLCRYTWFLRTEWEGDSDRVLELIATTIGFPSFVKPANLGSSVGVSRAEDENSLREAIGAACTYDRKIIVEEALAMREIECAVIGNDAPKASLPGEYVIRDKTHAFLDYKEKYGSTGNNEFVVPAMLSQELENKVRELAISAFKSIDGSGLARVDFFLRSDNGMLLVNEINTMPGLTDASGFPKMWAGSGMRFTEVITELIELAFERHRDRSRNKTTFDI